MGNRASILHYALCIVHCAFCIASPAQGAAAPQDDAARIARRAALVRELLDEGARGEAVAEANALIAEAPSATNALGETAVACALFGGTREGIAERGRKRRGPGTMFAAGVVGFYRLFVGPAIGERCVLEPSCSRYFLEASRRHGLLGVPMTADRFVREPVVSASDRHVIMPDGTWRHPDPVADHDYWFAKEAK